MLIWSKLEYYDYYALQKKKKKKSGYIFFRGKDPKMYYCFLKQNY